jgi:L-fuconolactonase
VRINAYFDEHVRMGEVPPDGLLRMTGFRAGFASLARLGLVGDVMVLHRQLPDVADLAQAFPDALWPWIEPVIDWFGPNRCMFESNFPADKVTCRYHILWNAFKRLTIGCRPADKQALFHDSAASVYSLPDL